MDQTAGRDGWSSPTAPQPLPQGPTARPHSGTAMHFKPLFYSLLTLAALAAGLFAATLEPAR